MIEAIISSLLLAGVSGLSFLAYKHPPAFLRLRGPIQITLLLALVGSVIWDVATSSTLTDLMPFVEPGKLSEASAALENRRLPVGWMLIGYLAVNFYLLFLSYLPKLISEDREADKGE